MGVSTETIAKYYSQAFETFDKHRNPPPIDVSFYPYVGINHTIRIRNGQVFVRIAEICRDLPASAQRALALILVAKLYRRRVPVAAKELYGAAVSSYGTTMTVKPGETPCLRCIFEEVPDAGSSPTCAGRWCSTASS